MTLHINNLPNELLSKIFSYISTHDLVLSVGNVCTHWNDIVKSTDLWIDRKYVCDENSKADDTVNILSYAPLLREFHLIDRVFEEGTDQILSALFQYCKILRTLVVKNVAVPLPYIIVQSVENFKELQKLHTYNLLTEDPDYSQEYPPHLFAGCTNIKKLLIPCETKLTASHIRSLSDTCKAIEELDISGVSQIGDSDIIYLIEKHKTTLVLLNIFGVSLTVRFFRKLSICTKLEAFGISRLNGTDEGLQLIGELRLKRFSLKWTCFPSSQMCKFFNEGNLAGLLELELCYCTYLDDQVLDSISSNCILLQSLSIRSCNEITDNGVAKVLKGCRQLKQLKLCYNVSLTGEFFSSVSEFATALEYMCVDKRFRYKVSRKREELRNIVIGWS